MFLGQRLEKPKEKHCFWPSLARPALTQARPGPWACPGPGLGPAFGLGPGPCPGPSGPGPIPEPALVPWPGLGPVPGPALGPASLRPSFQELYIAISNSRSTAPAAVMLLGH